jgi:hypothetical protein
LPTDVETIATVGGTASSPNYLMCLYEQLNEDNTDSVHFSILVRVVVVVVVVVAC